MGYHPRTQEDCCKYIEELTIKSNQNNNNNNILKRSTKKMALRKTKKKKKKDAYYGHYGKTFCNRDL